MKVKSSSEEIDAILDSYEPWKREILSVIRRIILEAAPEIVEEVKWKMPSRPLGLPVWSCNGIVCIAETFKDNTKLVFFKGAQLEHAHAIFNARLKSKTDRAIELKEGDTVDEAMLQELICDAVALNAQSKRPNGV